MIAPLFIPSLCRYEHFIRAIESLKVNTWAKYTDIYIALDYPANENHFPGYNRICEYLENGDFSCFHQFNVIKRPENWGTYRNCNAIRSEIMEKYDRWIYAEDDIEFSPNFLEFMNSCLDRYKNDPTVLAVNGYSYDIGWKVSENATVLKQKGTVSGWGIGFWKDKIIEAQKDLRNDFLRKQFSNAVKNNVLRKMISGRRCDYIRFALSGNKDNLFQNPSDISLGIYINLKDMYVITPVISKTRNHGFDGSGLFCERINHYTNKNSLEYNYDTQVIDMDFSVNIIEDTGNYYDLNIKALDRFLYVPFRQKIITNLMMLYYFLFGQDSCEKLYQFLKALKK